MFIWKIFTKGYQYNDTFKTIKGLFFFLDDNYDRCRGVCVTADSKQAIATAVFDNID